jgi:predicted Zn-dependent protease with MMP-like domain
MDYAEFEKRAQEIFHGIPPKFREGVDGVAVEYTTVEHPSLPGVYTLGECRSEYFPSEFGGAGDVLSQVVLYYGSFLALSRAEEEEWSWEDELWETVTHEVRHHLESLASEDALEELDYAEDQNFHRRQGEPFDPLFFRAAPIGRDGAYVVGNDLFLEMQLSGSAFRAAPDLRFSWRDREWTAPRPVRQGDVHFLHLREFLGEPEALFLVIVRRRGALRWMRDLLKQTSLVVLESEARAKEI